MLGCRGLAAQGLMVLALTSGRPAQIKPLCYMCFCLSLCVKCIFVCRCVACLYCFLIVCHVSWQRKTYTHVSCCGLCACKSYCLLFIVCHSTGVFNFDCQSCVMILVSGVCVFICHDTRPKQDETLDLIFFDFAI